MLNIIVRTIEPQIETILQKQENTKKPAIIIYGARQVGKTTLVKNIMQKYPEKSAYFNCDYLDVQETFSYEQSQKLGNIIGNLNLLVLDEAQRIKNIGLVIKILVDNFPNLQVIATGSSSFDLANKINEPLTGRKIVFNLFPIAFEELYQQLNPIEQKRQLDHLLVFGSYPEVVTKQREEAITKLHEITNSYLFKDIFSLQQLKKPELLTKLLRLLAYQIGSEVSFHELAQQLGADQTIIQKYIFLLEEAFVIFRLGAFKKNLRNEISKSRKIYFWDLGIRNALIQNFNSLNLRNDIGQLWENFCILERLKHNHYNHEESNHYFWRTYDQQEIDYIEEGKGKLFAYEFKWNNNKQPKLPQNFLTAYPNSNFSIINPDNFATFIV